MSLRTMAPLGCVALMLTTLVAPPLARAQDACYTRLPTERISLDLREAPVQTLLRLLSKQYRVNMVVTEDVAGTVTVSFFDLPVRDVFRGILEPNNLQCVEFADGILRVSSAARVRGDQQSAREQARSDQAQAEARAKAEAERVAQEEAGRTAATDALSRVPLEVRGIMAVPGGYRAIVNSQVVSVGDSILNHRVESITASEVILRRPDGAERVLSMPSTVRPAASGRQ